MSSKLNVTEIISGHFATLRLAGGAIAKKDIAVFVVAPVTLSVVFAVCGYDLNAEIRSLLVNFGAIFTALLLSVLVLVYDQERKYEDKKDSDPMSLAKKTLLHELYYNISFSIVCAISLVIISLIHALIGGIIIDISLRLVHVSGTVGSFLITPLVTFITVTIFLNVIMIVKRMHTLLTT